MWIELSINVEFVEDLTKEASDQRWEEVCSDAKLGQAPSNTAVWIHWGLSELYFQGVVQES